jgi:hypothetical protein
MTNLTFFVLNKNCIPLNSAAAVVSDLTEAPTITPCSQDNVSNTSGTPEKNKKFR